MRLLVERSGWVTEANEENLAPGAHDLRLDHDPKTDMPIFGRTYSTPNVQLDFVPSIAYEVHFTSTADAITLPLGPIQVARAIDSDNVTAETVRLGTLSFHPAGSSVFARTEDRTDEFISLRLSPGLRRSMEPDLDVGRSLRSIKSRPAPNALFLAKAIRCFLLSGAEGGRLAAESLATLALTDSLVLLKEQATADVEPAAGLDERRLAKVYEKIDANLDSNLDLAELAEMSGLSIFQFVRSFKARTGQTPYRYVTERRLLRASDMLARSENPIADIAYATGFSSQAHMTDMFRRRLGTTPGTYRDRFSQRSRTSISAPSTVEK